MQIEKNKNLDSFWKGLSKSKKGLLLLDYDGTLAPFTVNREEAYMYPEIIPILQQLMDEKHTKIIIISGREISSLKNLISLNPCPELFGTHGFERVLPNGEYQTSFPIESISSILDQVETIIKKKGWEKNIERKPASLAFHYRGEEKRKQKFLEKEIEKIFLPFSKNTPFILTKFDGGVELRLKDCTKQHAVEEILKENQGYTPAFLGDDTTDEDAFHVLKGKGLSVLVRKEYRPTKADIWLKPPEELVLFLEKWLKVFNS